MKITPAGKSFIQKITADNASLNLRFYGVRSPDGMIIGADIDTLIDTDYIINVEGYQIGISPEVLDKLETATIHADIHQKKEGLILLNCK